MFQETYFSSLLSVTDKFENKNWSAGPNNILISCLRIYRSIWSPLYLGVICA